MSTKSGKSLVFKEVTYSRDSIPRIVVFTVFDANYNPIGSILFFWAKNYSGGKPIYESGSITYRSNVKFDELDSTELDKARELARLIIES